LSGIIVVAIRVDLKTAYIYWEIDPVLPKNITLEQQVSPGAPWELLYKGDGTYYLDSSNLFLKNEGIKYRVRSNNEVGEAILDQIGDNYLYAVAEEYKYMLEIGLAGIKVSAYIKKDDDGFCPECYSEVLQKRTKTVCNTCDGSGRLGKGYKGPILIYVAFSKSNRSIDYSNGLSTKDEIIGGWTGNYPILSDGDIIIKDSVHRYVIETPPQITELTSKTNNKKFIVKQDIIMKKVGNEHPAMALGTVENV